MSRGEDPFESGGEHKYWYNMTSGEVEHGYKSPGVDRVGPFDTAEEAANALQTLRERSDAWAAEDAMDDDWRTTTDQDGK